MSVTRHRAKRSPQPKAEMSPSSSTHPHKAGSSSHGSGDHNRNDQIRGNQDASSEPCGDNRKKAPLKSSSRRGLDREGSNVSNATGKMRRDLNWMNTTAIGSAPVATKGGVSSGSSTSNSSSSTTTSNVSSSEGGKASIPPSHSVKGKSAPGNKKQQHQSSVGTRGHRSNSDVLRHMPDSPPPPSFPMNNHTGLDHQLSTTGESSSSSWSKSIYSSSKTSVTSNHTDHHSPTPYDNKSEFLWTSSQDSMDWNDVADLESQLLWAQSTDDDKIRK